MAVAIPDKRKLGPLPGLASTPMVSAPRDYTAAAVQNLGQAVQGLGKQVAIEQYDQNQTVQKAQQYETLAAADRFESERKLAAKERVLNMQPGAPGLASTWQAEDAKVREEFITKQPEFMRPGLKLALTRSGTNLHEYIVGKQDEEANRYAGVQFDKDDSRRISEAMDAMREAKTPEEMRTVLESAKAGSAKWSDNVPQFTPIQKEALKDTLDRRYALALADRVQKDPEFAKRFYDEAKPQVGAAADMLSGQPLAGRPAEIKGGAPKAQFAQMFAASDERTGVPGLAAQIAQIESRQNPNAKNPSSSAAGLFQFIDSTARRYGLGDKMNPLEATEAFTKLTLDNKASLRKSLGREPTGGELYLAHQQGAAGAAKILNGGDRPVEEIVGAEAARLNGGAGLTAAQFARKWTSKIDNGTMPVPGMDGGSASAAPAERPDTFGAVRTRFASLFPNAPAEVVTTLAERTISGVRQFDQEKRISIADAMENAPAALQQSGVYTGYMPSRQDFAVFGVEGEKKYEEFQTTNETAKTVHDMQTMPNAEIQRTAEASQPTSTGENAALEGKRSEAIQKAAASVLKARAADPSGYVMSAVPAVKQAWEGVEIGTPEYARAIRTTTEAQLALGIPATQVQPLPAAMAKSAVTMFKDETQAAEARLGAVVQSVFATKDEDQQQAIFRQMVKEGAPPEISAVLGAVKRGEPDAAQRLFTAMTSDPTKLPGVIRDKDALIDQQIETDIMAENQIGDIIYNLSSGSPEAQAKAQRDAPLIKKSVQLYVRGGKSLPDAVAATRRDLWGDVKIYPGQWGVNAMAVVPSGVDDAVLSHGIMNTVPAALRSALQARAESRIGTIDPKDIGVRNVTKQIADRAIDDVIDTSRIISLAPGRLGVSDERTGEIYKSPDGKELSWTIEELLAAGKIAPASAPASLDMWGGVAP